MAKIIPFENNINIKTLPWILIRKYFCFSTPEDWEDEHMVFIGKAFAGSETYDDLLQDYEELTDDHTLEQRLGKTKALLVLRDVQEIFSQKLIDPEV